MQDREFYGRTALVAALAVALAGVTGLTFEPTGSGPAAGTAHTSYLNLSIVVDPATGYPRYDPANVSVPAGRVVVTLTDHDVPMAWPACTCEVRGTVDGTERVNGTVVTHVDRANVAHTFTIPALGLNVLSPGGSVVEFTLDVEHGGTYVWVCDAPCGAGSDPYTSFPMGAPGFMSGTLTVL